MSSHPLRPLALILFSIATITSPLFASDDPALIKKSGTLLFEDQFERDESTPSKKANIKHKTSSTPPCKIPLRKKFA